MSAPAISTPQLPKYVAPKVEPVYEAPKVEVPKIKKYVAPAPVQQYVPPVQYYEPPVQ